MPRIRSSVDLSDHLNDAESATRTDLGGMHQTIGHLMSKWPNDRGLFVQLQRLASFIDATRAELSMLRPDEVKHEFIPKATDELDAIVEATASATHRIMDAADVVMGVTAKLGPEDSTAVMAAVTSIYEACSFQDITGQRVTKVVGMLKVIETRVDKMLAAMSDTPPPAAGVNAAAMPDSTSSQNDIDALFGGPDLAAPAVSNSTLDGPALPGKAKSQAEIDALFSDAG